MEVLSATKVHAETVSLGEFETLFSVFLHQSERSMNCFYVLYFDFCIGKTVQSLHSKLH